MTTTTEKLNQANATIEKLEHEISLLEQNISDLQSEPVTEPTSTLDRNALTLALITSGQFDARHAQSEMQRLNRVVDEILQNTFNKI